MITKRFGWLALCCVGMLGSQSSSAQGQAAATPQADNRDYNTVVADAMHEFDASHFAEARALFVRANELKPSARTLRGLGFTEFELRHYAAADRLLRASLVDTRNPLTSAQRSDVDALLVRIREFVGRYHISLDPASATLTVDGEPATFETDGSVLLEVGDHTLVASAPERSSEQKRIDVLGGDQKSLQLTLGPATAGSGVALQPMAAVAASAPTAPSATQPSGSPKLVPWLLVGGGAALTVTGIVLFAIGRGAASSVEDPKDGAPYASIRSKQDSAPVLSNVGLVFGLAGLVGAGVGVVLLTKHPSTESQVGASASLSFSPSGARLQGTF